MSGERRLGAVLQRTAERLRAAGIDEARREARALLSAFLPDAGAALYDRDRLLEGKQIAAINSAAARRARHEPLARILGRREFWSLEFGLNPETLVPRPDSETLVEAALQHCSAPQRPCRVLDLGTGSGCLLLALLSERPAAWGLGVDRVAGALRQAVANACALHMAERCAFLCGDWTTALAGRFDLIVSNPPYIESGALEDLEPEVALYDPRLALDGGPDGLAAYRLLVPQAAGVLASDGWLILEIGLGQERQVCALLSASGLEKQVQHPSLDGRIRAISASQG